VLPESGTAERRQLESDALDLGLIALEREHGNIPNALYRVYMTFRQRLIEERALRNAPDAKDAWCEALLDARQLEAFVNDAWAGMIKQSVQDCAPRQVWD